MKLFSLDRCCNLGRRLLTFALIGFLTLTGLLTIAVQPSQAQVPFNSKEAHGQTKEQLTGRQKGEPLSAEERLDRAYDISESAGMREEKRQAEGKFDPKEDNESLVEKATETVKRVTGNSQKSR
jgi:hypothetical protein